MCEIPTTPFFIEHVRWLLLRQQQQNSFFFIENTKQRPVTFSEMIPSDTFLKDEMFFYHCLKVLENSLEITAMELIRVKVASRSL